MLYAIIASDVANSLEKRLAARPAHIERLQQLKAEGRVVLAGPHPAIDLDTVPGFDGRVARDGRRETESGGALVERPECRDLLTLARRPDRLDDHPPWSIGRRTGQPGCDRQPDTPDHDDGGAEGQAEEGDPSSIEDRAEQEGQGHSGHDERNQSSIRSDDGDRRDRRARCDPAGAWHVSRR